MISPPSIVTLGVLRLAVDDERVDDQQRDQPEQQRRSRSSSRASRRAPPLSRPPIQPGRPPAARGRARRLAPPSPRSRRRRARRSRPRAPRPPGWISSRLTPAANDGCLSFFFTDFGFIPSIPVGRTRRRRRRSRESSSTANSVFARSVSRGTPRKVGVAGDRVDQLRRPVELGEQPQRRARMAVLGVVEVGEALVVEVVDEPGDRPQLLVARRARGRRRPSPPRRRAGACAATRTESIRRPDPRPRRASVVASAHCYPPRRWRSS